MACVDTMPGALTNTSSGFERVRYFPRQLLTADDMRIEQEYFRDKQRRHNRFLHGWGVVCGLEVKLDPESGPLAVVVCPGYALGPCGDEIYVPDPVPVDLGACVRKPADPCGEDGEFPAAEMPKALIVSIRYVECPTRPLRTLPAGCGCDDTSCEYSRIRDGFDVRCRTWTEPAKASRTPGICDIEHSKGKTAPPVPEMPTSPWIDLAVLSLTSDKKNQITSIDPSKIDNAIRRLVFSTAMIQDQLIKCCCQVKK
jgi:hypothetical protein